MCLVPRFRAGPEAGLAVQLRPSDTEPLLRLNLEVVTSELMDQKRDDVLSFIRS